MNPGTFLPPRCGTGCRGLMSALALTAAFHVAGACAAENDTRQDVSLHGFGTLGAVYHNTPGAEYRRDIAQAASGAKAGQLSFAQDSMLGVQADIRIDGALSASVQAVSRQDAEGSFRPELSMALLKYAMGDYQVRVGRLILETYLEGDSAEVGYANLMVRQPVIFYPRYMDGGDAEVTQPFGNGLLRVKAMGGHAVGKLPSGSSIYDNKNAELVGAGMEYSTGGWVGRFVSARYTTRDEIADLQPGGALATVLPMMPNGAQVRDMFALDGRSINLRMLEMSYEGGSLRSRATYAITRSRAWPTQYTSFVDCGYRLGEFMPYVSYSQIHNSRDFTGTGIPDGYSAQTDALNVQIVNAESRLFINQSDFILGVRYDFMQNRALKLQWDRIRYLDSLSLVDNGRTGRATNWNYKTMNLLSLALDFVF